MELNGRFIIADAVIAEAGKVDRVHDGGEGAGEIGNAEVVDLDGGFFILGAGDGGHKGTATGEAAFPFGEAAVEGTGGIAETLIREELADEVGTRVVGLAGQGGEGVGLLLTARGHGRTGHEHLALNFHQCGGHDQELAGEFDIDAVDAGEGGKILAGELGDGDVGDLDFVLADEVQEEVEGTVKGIEMDMDVVERHGAGGEFTPATSLRLFGAARCVASEVVLGDWTRTTELAFAERILRAQARAVEAVAQALGGDAEGFHRAAGLIETCARAEGTVLVSGLGKSGLVGAKISATLASLGITSHFVHPSEAAHGDLGRFRASDLCIALSASGETDEVVALASILKQDNIPVIAICKTGGPPSSLERLATATLGLGSVAEEAEISPAPTLSTTVSLALGDALALCASQRLGFTDQDFARRHPGGALGGLLRPVVESLRFTVGKNLVPALDDVSLEEALRTAESVGRRPGALLLVDRASGRLTGVFTDADLRRVVLKDPGALKHPVADFMTRQPGTLADTALLRDAVRMIREFRRDEIPVVDDGGRPVGILDVQDLIAMRLVKE